MTKIYNAPVLINFYLGSGESALKLRENIKKKGGKSVSQFLMALIKKADPSLFKGVDHEKRA